MATRGEIEQLFAAVAALYPVPGESEKTLAVVLEWWVRLLSEFPYHVLRAAVDDIVASGREYRPPPGLIRQRALDLTGAPSPDRAMGQALAAWGDLMTSLHSPPAGLTKDVLKSLGLTLYDLRQADAATLAAHRRAFVDLYAARYRVMAESARAPEIARALLTQPQPVLGGGRND